MAAAVEATRAECGNLGERATDLWRRATKMTDDVGALKTAVTDVIEEGKEVAARGVDEVRRRARHLKEVPDKLASRASDHPFRAIGVAMGVGLIAGVLLGWFAARTSHQA